MNKIATNLKEILNSLAVIFSTIFRKAGCAGGTILDTLRTIIIFGSTAIIGIAIFIYALLLAALAPTKEWGMTC